MYFNVLKYSCSIIFCSSIFLLISIGSHHYVTKDKYPDSLVKPHEVRDYYNKIGSFMDYQFYEYEPTKKLLNNLGFKRLYEKGKKLNILEIGCGTGRLAKMVLDEYHDKISYISLIDISKTMIDLTERKIKSYIDKNEDSGHLVVDLRLLNFLNETEFNEYFGKKKFKFDVIYSTYVFDLMPNEMIKKSLDLISGTLLKDGGKFGVVGITRGRTFFSKFIGILWEYAYYYFPVQLGGCRPMEFMNYIDSSKWFDVFYEILTPYSIISSEVIVLKKKGIPKIN